MSLNRSEQMVHDYLQANPDEQRHWQGVVRATAERERDPHAAAAALDHDLWAYYQERAGVVSPFREEAAREGLRRISMRNLAEYLLRLWGPARKRPAGQPPARPYA